jgi:hypothetical protein
LSGKVTQSLRKVLGCSVIKVLILILLQIFENRLADIKIQKNDLFKEISNFLGKQLFSGKKLVQP